MGGPVHLRWSILIIVLALVLIAPPLDVAAVDTLEVFAGQDKHDARVNVPVIFNDAKLVSPSPPRTDRTYSFSWDFDAEEDLDQDGIYDNDNESTTLLIEHAFVAPGSYNVTLTCSDNTGATAKDTLVVRVVGNAAPEIDAPTTMQTYAGTPVYLEANASDETTPAALLDWEWDFGDGRTGGGPPPMAHTYESPGTYQLRIRVHDQDGAFDDASLTVEVLPRDGAYHLQIGASSWNVSTGELVTFYANITPPLVVTIKSIKWDLGDGTILSGDRVSHRFMQPGNYSINLTIVGDGMVHTLRAIILVHDGSEDGGLRVAERTPGMRLVAGATGACLLLAIAAFGATETGKYSLLGVLLPLYTRLRKDEVLDQFTRGKIFGYVVANPGDHYNSIRDALEITNGSFAYHMRILEEQGFVRSRPDGSFRRFYPASMRLPQDAPRIRESQVIILERIKEAPGISQREIARQLGVSSSTVSYHLAGLLRTGAVRSERRGMSLRYFPSTG